VSYSTDQENFWAQEFGDSYIERNKSEELLASNVSFFAQVFKKAQPIESLVELGANIGMNIGALSVLFPNTRFAAVEINDRAASELTAAYPETKVYNESILDFTPDLVWDVALVKGVLIHLNPETLPMVYEKLSKIASKYVVIAEYYNPTPVALSYRGHSDRLFKRDFAGEFLDSQTDFRLLDYGFSYHRDELFPQDDINWFLLQKS
jgi:pseudaminic acid biosynthesis-associated methylase